MSESTTLYFRDEETNSDKFYTATLNGASVTFTWGRRGSIGQSKTFPTGGYSLYREKLAEKRAKGYQCAHRDVPRSIPQRKPAPAPEPEQPAGWPRGIRHVKPNTE